jgi:hypothetical protein
VLRCGAVSGVGTLAERFSLDRSGSQIEKFIDFGSYYRYLPHFAMLRDSLSPLASKFNADVFEHRFEKQTIKKVQDDGFESVTPKRNPGVCSGALGKINSEHSAIDSRAQIKICAILN